MYIRVEKILQRKREKATRISSLNMRGLFFSNSQVLPGANSFQCFWKGFPNMCYTVRESLFGCRRQQSEGTMAQTPPIIQDGILTYQLDGQPAQLVVDSADWYGWLAAA